MKTQVRFLIVLCTMICFSGNSFAFSYYITFTGSGAGTTVDSVVVQNLYQGTRLKVPAGTQLRLYDVETSVDRLNAIADFACVYPNPITDKATYSFVAKNDGNTQISVYGIDGRKVTGMDIYLLQGKQSFQLTLPKGVYLIQAKGNGFSYTTKIISLSMINYQPVISFTGNISKPQKALATEVKMQYTTGDQLLYKGYSGNYCTIVTDIPTESKTTDFEFVICTDAEGNHYAVVHIGTQTWMAENLKSTKFNDGISIPKVTGGSSWAALSTPAYCWYNNDSTTYKALYGALYNWHAVNTAKLAPTGWHVPTDAEWTALTVYVTANLGPSISLAKALAAATNWATSTSIGAIGNDLSKNNSTGFSALPGGFRSSDGTFFDVGRQVYWWSSSELVGTSYAKSRGMYYDYHGVSNPNYNKKYGFSVSCVRDL